MISIEFSGLFYDVIIMSLLLFFFSGHSCFPSPQTNIPKFFIENSVLSFCSRIDGLAF